MMPAKSLRASNMLMFPLSLICILSCHRSEGARLLQQQVVMLNPGQLQQGVQPVVAQVFTSAQAIGNAASASAAAFAQATGSGQSLQQQVGNWVSGASLPAGQPGLEQYQAQGANPQGTSWQANGQQQYGQQQYGQQQGYQQSYGQQQNGQAQGGQVLQDGQGYSPSSAPSTGDPISDPELQTTLDMHNQFRAKHQVGSLSWSSQLAAGAQQWADQCVFQHSGPGENLAQYFTNFRDVTQAWYDEVKDYHYDGQFSETTGHFTEMVWKAATQLGCGYNTGCQLYVCHYNPSGNVLGSFQDNVFQPTS